MAFIDDIRELNESISFQQIRNVAMRLLPNTPAEQERLYDELIRGTKILDDEPHMNMYLKCYGNMHEAKIRYALDHMPNVRQLFSEDIELFDWGCGQGLATICTLDYLAERRITPHIRRITLIEPSNAAITRASEIIKCYSPCKEVEIRLVEKTFDLLAQKDVSSLNCRKLHLFSNILDVATFDLVQFTHLFQETQKGGNYIVCVSPVNAGYKRLDWFIEAINPSERYLKEDKPKGTWIGSWTLSVRIAAGFVTDSEDIAAIKKRISDAQKHSQMFAGYVTDALSDTLCSSEYSESSEALLASLSMFDVQSDKSLEHEENIDPILAVLSNIISRGMPTRAPLLIENELNKAFEFSNKPIVEPVEFHYDSTDKCSAKSFFEALHIIYPQWKLDAYNTHALESNFENTFIQSYLPENDKSYLAQVLEPQRPLSSIIDIPNQKYKNFVKDQRVDFALEMPYSSRQERTHIGFVVEINGKPYHSSVASKIKDAKRNALVTEQDWGMFNLETTDDKSFSNNIERDERFASYLSILKQNYQKELSSEWKDTLQFVLVPFAVARIEKVLTEALISGYLDINANKWKIAVIERDIPCAAIAIKDLRESYEHLCALRGSNEKFPSIELTIISNQHFVDSPLHLGNRVRVDQKCSIEFDICIDTSILLRDKIADLPIEINSKTFYVVRSSHYSKAIRTIYSAENIEYEPLVKKTVHGEYISLPEREEVLEYFLQNLFRKYKFREGQLPILSRVLTNKTTIGLLPTGGGKSLTYQLPSLLQPGVTIVVDPLVTLMVDQYNGLVNQRIDVSACINSSMSRVEKSFHLGRLQSGQVQFMLLSPERFMMKEDFRDEILSMNIDNHVYFSYGVIDEVHTVSEWGHDFRPAYLQLGRNMTRFMQTKTGKDVAVIGLTATASFDVLADVERELTLGGELSLDSDAIVKPELSEREELTYHIEQVQADYSVLVNKNNPYILDASPLGMLNVVTSAKKSRLRIILDRVPEDIAELNNRVEKCSDEKVKETSIINYNPDSFFSEEYDKYNNAGIVFCPYREGGLGVKDKITQWRFEQGIANYVKDIRPDIEIGTFIGGDDPTIMDPFKRDKQSLMVATKAFGMGIDKPNVRYTINITHPSSIESYVQEAGRAGRDKKVAISYLFHEPTEYVQLTKEAITEMFGNTIPTYFKTLKDKIILFKDIRPAFNFMGVPDNMIDQCINILSKHKLNVDKEIQMYFHNNSFKGAYKEKIILAELAYNQKGTLSKGIYDAINNLTGNEYAEVIIPWENDFNTNANSFNASVMNAAQLVASRTGWTVPGVIDAFSAHTFEELIANISKNSNDENWETHQADNSVAPLKNAYYLRRDKDDTDKAIYRMCCIGLVDDVTIDYVNEFYTVKVSRKTDDEYYDALNFFFLKYYSTEQALRKTNEAREHRGQNASDKCMGYLADFIYENLEVKRRRAIDDMRDACIKGATQGDEDLKKYIHLYFNSKYARDTHTVNGQNYSLRRDVDEGLPVLDIIWKYINVMNNDPSGSEADNIKHLYGAVLIILRAQAEDNMVNPALFLLRSFCLACLGTNNNETLIEEFREGYSKNGFYSIIEHETTQDPVSMKDHIDRYNKLIIEKSKPEDLDVKECIENLKAEMNLRVIARYYNDFTTAYLNNK